MLVYGALGGPLPKLGVVAAAVLAAVVMLHRDTRVQALAMLGALVLAPVLLLADIWHSPQLGIVHRHPLVAAAGRGRRARRGGGGGVAAREAAGAARRRRDRRAAVPDPDPGRWHDLEPARTAVLRGRRRVARVRRHRAARPGSAAPRRAP